MPIFELLSIAEVADWARLKMARPLVDTFAFARVEQQVGVTEHIVDDLQVSAEIDRRSGLVRFTSQQDAAEHLLASAREVARALDPARTWVDEATLEAEESRPPSVLAQYLSSLDGVLSLGPGGRVTMTRLGNSLVLEVTVRTRITMLQSAWEPPQVVTAAVQTLLDNGPSDVRLRGAFGYTEASRYEPPGLMRPAFVLLLDRPAAIAGPYWRVETTIPATRLIDDDLPPWLTVPTSPGACV